VTAHLKHDVHANSRISFAALDLAEREALVLNAYLLAGVALTDRQVAERLGLADMNGCRPQISRLIDRAWLMESGSVKDEATNRRVRTCEPTSLARKGGG
jgi:hypothetical protein